jgi:hypothetical protein
MSLRREVASRASGSLATGIGNAGRGPGAAASIHTRSLGTRRISRPRCDREPQSTIPLAARVPVALRRKSVTGSRPRSLERTVPGREQDEVGIASVCRSVALLGATVSRTALLRHSAQVPHGHRVYGCSGGSAVVVEIVRRGRFVCSWRMSCHRSSNFRGHFQQRYLPFTGREIEAMEQLTIKITHCRSQQVVGFRGYQHSRDPFSRTRLASCWPLFQTRPIKCGICDACRVTSTVAS